MSILGNRVVRTEDPDLLTGAGQYVDDINLANAAHVTFVVSTMAHAHLADIDTSETKSMPGVLGVWTAVDLPFSTYPAPMFMLSQEMPRTYLATDKVRYVGEPIVAIVTDEYYQGQDAAETVIVDYDPLDVVVRPEDAETSDVTIHEAVTDNVVGRLGTGTTADFDGCDVVVEQRLVNQRLAPAPIEGRISAATWEDGRLVQYSSCQGAHPTRDHLATAYGLENDQVRVVVRNVGGSFGAKAGQTGEETILGHLSREVGRPVRWNMARSHDMVGLAHGRGQIQTIKIGGSNDGRITAYQLHVIQDGGAYPGMGAVLPFMTQTMAPGVYDLPNIGVSSVSVATNTTPTTAYRGAGRPEAAAAIERAVDMFAAEIGMDPAEVRRKNFLAKFDEPVTTSVGTIYDVGDYERALDLALEQANYAELRTEQARRREAGDTVQLGIGLGAYVEITAFGGGGEFGTVELQPDGTVLAKTGSSPFGQGHYTSWAMLISDQTGLAMDDIEIFHGDTDVVAEGGTTGGSRSLQIAGSSMQNASVKLVELAKDKAADLLEASVDDIVLDTTEGAFHVAGTPAKSVDWAAIAGASDDVLMGVSDFSADGPTFPFGAHVCVAEVDTDTGMVTIDRMIAVDDAGVILNPLLVAGQVHGGLAQGVAQALLEEFIYDEDGNPLTSNLGDYTIPSTMELPMFERVPMETPTFMNPLGAKGIGESGTIGATPAVQNAVVDAVSHLGVRHIDMPCTPERVWTAIQEAR
ncbi:MAG: xanthine dehydrogenase family protein molybdopterin-binding subunit [Actinobacteria bacterium]|nr:xanthine dehydrogenase family protein molybdopterin-binding subunit [Actinomycetota bacterium]